MQTLLNDSQEVEEKYDFPFAEVCISDYFNDIVFLNFPGFSFTEAFINYARVKRLLTRR